MGLQSPERAQQVGEPASVGGRCGKQFLPDKEVGQPWTQPINRIDIPSQILACWSRLHTVQNNCQKMAEQMIRGGSSTTPGCRPLPLRQADTVGHRKPVAVERGHHEGMRGGVSGNCQRRGRGIRLWGRRGHLPLWGRSWSTTIHNQFTNKMVVIHPKVGTKPNWPEKRNGYI